MAYIPKSAAWLSARRSNSSRDWAPTRRSSPCPTSWTWTTGRSGTKGTRPWPVSTARATTPRPGPCWGSWTPSCGSTIATPKPNSPKWNGGWRGGDAGYCCSPLSGQGTSVALLGAYILAGELAAATKDGLVDHELGFANYYSDFHGYIERTQWLATDNVPGGEPIPPEEFYRVVDSITLKDY